MKDIAPARKLLIVLISLFLIETAVMEIIEYLRFPYLLEGVLHASALILLVLPVLYWQFVRPMIQQYDELRTNRSRLQALTRKIVSIQENERLQITRDLYDEVGQSLISALYQLRLLEGKANHPDQLHTSVVELDKQLSEIIERLNRLAVALRPASLDHLGLSAAIHQDLDELSEKQGIKVEFETAGEMERLPQEIEIVLYRIFHEAIHNIVRHASATRVGVMMRQGGGRITLVIEDNGKGFDLEAMDQSKCIGLLGMRERAEMICGELSIETAPDKGTTVFVSSPYPTS
jgi:signal transduction histidine kinase